MIRYEIEKEYNDDLFAKSFILLGLFGSILFMNWALVFNDFSILEFIGASFLFILISMGFSLLLGFIFRKSYVVINNKR